MSAGPPDSSIADLIREMADLQAPGVSIDASTQLFSSRLLDSLQFLEVLSAVEAELGRSIADEDLLTETFDSLKAIEGLMRRYAAEGTPRT